MHTLPMRNPSISEEETLPRALDQWGQIPAQLGPYRILRSLGQGASARVFLAENTGVNGLRQQVALKVASPDKTGRTSELLRLESQILSTLRHPNIIQFHGTKQSQGWVYGVMDPIEGWTLKQLLKRDYKIPLSVCLDFGLQICSALNYLHGDDAQTAVVHSDIKPSNLMVDRFGHITLIDFGISSAPIRTVSGSKRSGTAAYMAPEQILKKPLDGRADLFALGVVLYEMVTGTRLFPGSDIPKLLRQRLYATHLPKTGLIHAMLGDPLHHLMTTLQGAIHCNPNDRYANANTFAEALRGVQRKTGIHRSSERWIQQITKNG